MDIVDALIFFGVFAVGAAFGSAVALAGLVIMAAGSFQDRMSAMERIVRGEQ